MNVGPFQILIIALVILVLFGRGRISDLMGDFGKGVKSFRQGMGDDEATHPAPASRIAGAAPEARPTSGAAADGHPAPDQTHK